MKIRWRELVLRIRKDSLQVQMKDEYFSQYSTPSGRTMTGGNGNGIKPDGTNFFDICCCPLTHCFTIFTRNPNVQQRTGKRRSHKRQSSNFPFLSQNYICRMASRLASLTPSKNARSRGSPSPSPSPAQSPPRPTETTHHRMLKLVIGEIKNVIRTWDEIVILEGFKAAKGCVDESTEMESVLLT